MERYTLPAQQKVIPAVPRAVALGLFDGLHCGHRAVIAATLREEGRCAVYTFQPATVTTKPDNRALLNEEELYTRMKKNGVQDLMVADFNTVRHLSPAAFVDEILVAQLHATAVVCGFNYRFGAGGAGDTDTLTALCADRGIRVTVVPPTAIEGETVSSTAIRRALAAGDMARVRRMLSSAYCLRLPVTEGQHLGHRLGMPTINQVLPAGMALPRFGVYASFIEIGEETYYGVTNIGLRPTVGTNQPLAETWINGLDTDLYGRTVAVYPVAFLREEIAFPDLNSLKEQMRRDARQAADLFAPTGRVRAVLFDFDDTLHKRDEAFMRALNRFADRHYPDITPTDKEKLVEEMFLFNRHGYGMTVSFGDFIARFLPRDSSAQPEEALRRFFIDYGDGCAMEADAIPTLTALREQGCLVGVISNGGSLVQNHKMDATGLRPLLDITVVSGDEGVHKPDPVLFRRVAGRLGVAPEDCVYVGDHPINDMQGAASAGMRTVYIDYPRPADHPCYSTPTPDGVPTVHRLAPLPEMLST